MNTTAFSSHILLPSILKYTIYPSPSFPTHPVHQKTTKTHHSCDKNPQRNNPTPERQQKPDSRARIALGGKVEKFSEKRPQKG